MAVGSIDLNADLGEGADTDDELLAVVSSASVACGGHAGDRDTMAAVVAQAQKRGVTVGAHPSYPDREGFGRRPLDLPAADLLDSLIAQVAALAEVARPAFMKPHGALYNRAATDRTVASIVVEAARSTRLPLLCPAGSEMSRQAVAAGVEVFAEGFADRAYTPDGRLAPRSGSGAVLDDPVEVAARAVALALSGTVPAVDGSALVVKADSICIHGDTPGAVVLALAVRAELERAGVAVRAFAI
ncbi:MAG TPA: 5-oxoprolinase subunit PxpA [Acidimicrobiales bacterium]|nr:5-oxoprolinase subunit PxpA [Acidimicrobiales bacterium]